MNGEIQTEDQLMDAISDFAEFNDYGIDLLPEEEVESVTINFKNKEISYE